MNTHTKAVLVGCGILLIGINAGMFLSKTAELRWKDYGGGAQGAQDHSIDLIDTPMAATSVVSNRGQFFMKGVANKTPLTFLVDTGASWIVFDRRNAARLGIDVKALKFDGTSVTANGLLHNASTHIATLTVGPFTRKDVPVTVNDNDMGGEAILGMTFLSQFRLEMSNGVLTMSGDPE